jgi:Tfp pilus assembly protein PilW
VIKQKGFTIIEAVVATTVFAFVFSSIVGIYLSTIQLDRKSRSERSVAENARFIMEFLAKEVRNGRIDYSAYSGQTANEVNELHIINQGEEPESFRLAGSNCNTNGICNITLTKGTETTNLNSTYIRITKLEFRVSPIGDPFTAAENYNEQPRVTIFIEFTSHQGAKAIDVAKMNLQTTLSTRYYPPRN